MPTACWARLREDIDCGMRRGAWYDTVSVGQFEISLAVHGQERTFSRDTFDIVATRPTRWTIVVNASNASVIPARWAKGYAVCPQCAMRQLPMGRPQALRCDGCNGLYEVAWEETYLDPYGGSNSGGYKAPRF